MPRSRTRKSKPRTNKQTRPSQLTDAEREKWQSAVTSRIEGYGDTVETIAEQSRLRQWTLEDGKSKGRSHIPQVVAVADLAERSRKGQPLTRTERRLLSKLRDTDG